MKIIKRKEYNNLIDTPKNDEERIFDEIYEKYKEMFKTDFVYIGVISRKVFGKKKKIRFRFGNYIMDKTLLDLYYDRKKDHLGYLK